MAAKDSRGMKVISDQNSWLQLTTRITGGDESAFTFFYEHFFDRLFRYVLVMTRGNEQLTRRSSQETDAPGCPLPQAVPGGNHRLGPGSTHMNALPGRGRALVAGTCAQRGAVGGQVDQHPVPEPLRRRGVGVEAGDGELFVPSGSPDHDSCGDVFPAAATWSSLSGWPSVTSSLVTVNDGTLGQ